MRRLYFNDNQIRSVRYTFLYSVFVFVFPLLQCQPDHITSYHIITFDKGGTADIPSDGKNWRDPPEREQVKHCSHSTIHILVIDEDSFK